MFLTPANLPHYLVRRGSLKPSDIVNGDLVVFEEGRRNRNFKVLGNSGAGLFVKQVQTFTPEALQTLSREASTYRLVSSDANLAALAPYLPHFIDADEQRYVLTMALIPHAESLSQCYLREKRFSAQLGQALAHCLATYHGPLGHHLTGARNGKLFPGNIPWILRFHHGNGYQMSAGNQALLHLLKGYPGFADHLEALARDWRRESLIHGDIKWDNVLVSREVDGSSQKLYLIDWEIADLGDPRWDLGAVFQAYLAAWALSISSDVGPAQQHVPTQVNLPLEPMLPTLHAFWRTYCAARQIKAPDRSALLHQSLRMAAARMVQTAYEHLSSVQQLSPQVRGLLQVSFNIFEQPQRAASELLQMPVS